MHYYVVLDTNVLVSAMLRFQSVPGQILSEVMLGKLTPILNEEILDEYKEVLARPKFKFNQDLINIVIDEIVNKSIFVEPFPTKEVFPDPKDIIFYEVVVSGRMEFDTYLVTGNIKHFPVKAFVVTPREMLDIIQNNQ